MTDEQLAEIKARAEVATPGPWVFSEGTTIGGSIKGNGWRVDLTSHSYQAWLDVFFLAHARTDIPLLLLEIERLRAEVERLQHQAIGLSESASKSLILYANAGTEADGLRAEVERLQEEIERLRVEGTSPKPGFLAWVMQVEDALPPGMARGVNVEKLQRWHEAGMTVEGAADRVRGH